MRLPQHEISIFYGSMGACKSFHVIRQLQAASFEDANKVVAFKPYDPEDPNAKIKAESLYSREKNLSFPSIPVPQNDPEKIIEYLDQYIKDKKLHSMSEIKLVGHDEMQFYSPDIIKVLNTLSCYTEQVGAGLNTNSDNKGFGSMPTIIAIADNSLQVFGFCSAAECAAKSTKTYRDPSAGDQEIIIGDIKKDVYFPMCRYHYAVAKKQGLGKMRVKKVSSGQ